jgi:hypothetical protein
MQRRVLFLAAAAISGGAIAGCGNGGLSAPEESGQVEVELTNAPADASCLRLTVSGSRTDVRTFSLTAGQNASFNLKGLPVGNASIAADAFEVACNKLVGQIDPTWYSEPVSIRVTTNSVTHVALLMIHNGRISVGVDFSDTNGPHPLTPPPLTGGTFTTQTTEIVPILPGIVVKPILTVGDSPNLKPDGVTPYRMVGIPDGLGAFDNGDGTFTLLSNHELQAPAGIARAHGGKSALVSRWIIRKADFAVLHGEDLIQQVILWNPMTSSYSAPVSGAAGVSFSRFCSADLPAPGALFDVATGLGFDGKLFFDGEELGVEGRSMAHGMDGTSYELPRLGKQSWENSVANPGTGVTTVVAELDDTSPLGQVYFYFGTKTSSGSPVEKAGLTNGTLYGLRVIGVPVEDTATGIATGPFELYSFGNVENLTGAALEDLASANSVTKLMRPEDGSWDPNNPNDFYFVSTASTTLPSRLWRVRFKDASRADLGGTFEMLLDGTEGQKMFDNITIDHYGHVYLLEDVGANDRVGKIWRYDIATDALVEIARENPALFDPTIMSPTFLTNDEEASGIIDASDVLGPGWLLVDVQNHKVSAEPELVEGGQYLAIYDPAAAGH